MTGDQVKVDPDAMRASAQPFTTLATEYRAVVVALDAALQAEGECWGGDDPGEEFKKKYQGDGEGLGTADQAVAKMQAVPDKLDQWAMKIIDTANGLERVNEENRQKFAAIEPTEYGS